MNAYPGWPKMVSCLTKFGVSISIPLYSCLWKFLNMWVGFSTNLRVPFLLPIVFLGVRNILVIVLNEVLVPAWSFLRCRFFPMYTSESTPDEFHRTFGSSCQCYLLFRRKVRGECFVGGIRLPFPILRYTPWFHRRDRFSLRKIWRPTSQSSHPWCLWHAFFLRSRRFYMSLGYWDEQYKIVLSVLLEAFTVECRDLVEENGWQIIDRTLYGTNSVMSVCVLLNPRNRSGIEYPRSISQSNVSSIRPIFRNYYRSRTPWWFPTQNYSVFCRNVSIKLFKSFIHFFAVKCFLGVAFLEDSEALLVSVFRIFLLEGFVV